MVERSDRFPICEAWELEERGPGRRFDVLFDGETVTAFVLRFDGQWVAWVNRCRHIPIELDIQEGQFLDSDGALIICSTHGALYEPVSGLCLAGPCAGASLWPVPVSEEDGQLWWHETDRLKPVPPGGQEA